MCAIELSDECEAVVPSTLVDLWQPVLYMMNKLQLTTHLLDGLAAELTEVGDLSDYLTAGWIARILAAISNSSLVFI